MAKSYHLTAVNPGYMPLVRRMIDRAQYKLDLRVKLLNKPEDGLIEEAIKEHHVDILECLLTQAEGIETHVQHRNSGNQNMLHVATKVCNPLIFQRLVPLFKDAVHQTDNKKDSVLDLKLIIDSGKNVRDRYQSALILLIEGGANDNSKLHDELKLLQEDYSLRETDRVMCRLLGQYRKTNPLPIFSRDDDSWNVPKDDANDNDHKVLQIVRVLCARGEIGSVLA